MSVAITQGYQSGYSASYSLEYAVPDGHMPWNLLTGVVAPCPSFRYLVGPMDPISRVA